MPRQLRIQFPGAMYHVMSRGNRRAEIFLDDVDRHDSLKTLAEACQKTGWQRESPLTHIDNLLVSVLGLATNGEARYGSQSSRNHQQGRWHASARRARMAPVPVRDVCRE